jgi:hypothetical protein
MNAVIVDSLPLFTLRALATDVEDFPYQLANVKFALRDAGGFDSGSNDVLFCRNVAWLRDPDNVVKITEAIRKKNQKNIG